MSRDIDWDYYTYFHTGSPLLYFSREEGVVGTILYDTIQVIKCKVVIKKRLASSIITTIKSNRTNVTLAIKGDQFFQATMSFWKCTIKVELFNTRVTSFSPPPSYSRNITQVEFSVHDFKSHREKIILFP